MSLWVAPGSVAEESSSGSGGAYTGDLGKRIAMAKVVVGTVADFPENEPTEVRCEIGTLCIIRTAEVGSRVGVPWAPRVIGNVRATVALAR